MADTPIAVALDVGGELGNLVIVGDPSDGLFAINVGRAVAVAIMELGAKLDG